MPNQSFYVPPRFTPVGLARQQWVVDRWFLTFDGLIGRPATAVTLGYSNPSSPERILVRTEEASRELGEGHLAESAMHLLINAVDSGIKPPGGAYTERVQDLIRRSAQDFSGWPEADWNIAGKALVGRTREFSGAWCGYVSDGVYRGVAVVGYCVNRADVAFEDVASSHG